MFRKQMIGAVWAYAGRPMIFSALLSQPEGVRPEKGLLVVPRCTD